MSKTSRWILGGLGAFFLLNSLLIIMVEFNRFTGQPVLFPEGSRIASVPVDGLDAPAAEARLVAFYDQPLVLTIADKAVHVDPADLGFTFDATALVSIAASQIETASFLDFLRGQVNPPAPVVIPLTANVDEDQIRAYLQAEIEPRYTQPGVPGMPIPNTTNFSLGEPGQHLEIDQAVIDIRAALLTEGLNQVSLELGESAPSPPTFAMLEVFLQHNIDWIGYNDLVEVYLQSMNTGEVLHFAERGAESVPPDIAFPAASTNKIPIMLSVLRRTDEPIPEAVITLLMQMIALSENPPADTLMSTYLHEVRGPLIVSQDMTVLGMENTFLAGFFYLGAPLLQRFETPANTRTDVNLNPDIYNQTVPSEAGRLLAAIHTCAQDGSGLLIETFPGEITQEKCQLMIEVLLSNNIGLLMEAGLPYGVSAAHKHGWAPDLDGQLRFMSDVGIVLTEGGDYVLNVFLHDSERLDFEQGNRLIARLSQTVYNFFNLNEQTYWWFD